MSAVGEPLAGCVMVVTADRRKTELANVKLRGSVLEFSLDAGERATDRDRYQYRGKVLGDSIQGEVQWGSGIAPRHYAWKATRIEAPSVPLAH